MLRTNELLRDYDLSLGHPVSPSHTFNERMNTLIGIGSLLLGIPARTHDSPRIMEGGIGLIIQENVRAYIQGLIADPDGEGAIFDRQGERVLELPVGNGLVLRLDDEINLYRSPRVRWGHEVGNPPLNPDEWLRNARGILRAVSRIGRTEPFRTG